MELESYFEFIDQEAIRIKGTRVGIETILRDYEVLLHGVRCGEDRAIWAEEDDPRVTRVGRILGRIHVDESPQFLNIPPTLLPSFTLRLSLLPTSP